MTPADDRERMRIREAAAGMQAVLTSVAAEVIARIDERCPYRGRGDRCTFAGGCRNQRRETRTDGAVLRCAGDHPLRRLPR